MSWTELAVASGVVAIGAMIQGSIGFGVNVVAGPVLVIIDPSLVPGPALVVAFVLTVLVAVRDRAETDLGGFGWVFAGRVPGTVAGAFAVTALPERGLALVLAVVVLAAVGVRAGGWRVERTPGTLAGAGVLSGVMGTVSSIGGPPVALLYADERGGRVRGTLSSIFAVGAALSLVLLAAVGRFGRDELRMSAALLPAVLVGFAISRFTARTLDRGYVRPAVLGLCALSAVAALVRYA